ncbi:unnamed protein product [Arabis nemorensis]|uniref:Uncharacterized protein n=1 Tax=Arabis nemorensis TaxID=586526 RepID=A0A565AT12_9BRAS|nr:unnamed protein product [Arabis nemorensis]
MKEMMITRDVIVYRGIWYVMTLLSILECKSSSSRSRFLRDDAVSATTFYAVTLFKYLFFTDPHSSSYYKDNEFITFTEMLPQAMFSYFALHALMVSPLMYTVSRPNSIKSTKKF